MWWFGASPRRATPKGHILHLSHSIASRSSSYIELLSAFVAHVINVAAMRGLIATRVHAPGVPFLDQFA
jgi:hypothetical protein